MKLDQRDAALAACLWPGQIPVREIECRHCEQPNEVDVRSALFATQSCECGACEKPIFLGRDEPLSGLTASVYQHSMDKKAIEALTSLPGFSTAIKWLLKQTAERGFRVSLMASAIRCDETQFPELLALLESARKRLGFARRPTLYLSESPAANAFTTGAEDHVVVVFSGLLDILNDDQVLAVLGHELGHIHAEHNANRVLAFLLTHGGAFASGLGRLVTWPLSKALMSWGRSAELTADRAALLASRDLRASVEIFLSFAGGNRRGVKDRTTLSLTAFVQQARELAKLESSTALDGIASTILTMDQTHPFAAWRLMHLLEWAEKGSLLEILAGHYRRTAVKNA